MVTVNTTTPKCQESGTSGFIILEVLSMPMGFFCFVFLVVKFVLKRFPFLKKKIFCNYNTVCVLTYHYDVVGGYNKTNAEYYLII